MELEQGNFLFEVEGVDNEWLSDGVHRCGEGLSWGSYGTIEDCLLLQRHGW